MSSFITLLVRASSLIVACYVTMLRRRYLSVLHAMPDADACARAFAYALRYR